MTSLAMLGSGRMGTAIARRLLATGHRVAVWDRKPAKAAALASAGAAVATTPVEAVGTSAPSAAAARSAPERP